MANEYDAPADETPGSGDYQKMREKLESNLLLGLIVKPAEEWDAGNIEHLMEGIEGLTKDAFILTHR